jgi:hypothetical protein
MNEVAGDRQVQIQIFPRPIGGYAPLASPLSDGALREGPC